MGTPSMIAPAVPYTLVRMNGRMPYFGSADVDDHTLPVRNGTRPIWLDSRDAGDDEIHRDEQHTADRDEAEKQKNAVDHGLKPFFSSVP